LLSLRSQARNFYYQVMLGDESIDVEHRRVQASKQLLEITQALVSSGKMAGVETMRARIRLQGDQRQYLNAVTQRDKAALNAKNFIYLPLEQPVQFVSKLEFEPFPISLDRLIHFAMLHRPELKTLRRQRELARLDREESQETTRPTLSLTGGYLYSGVSPTYYPGWNVGATAHWRIFDSFITRDNVRIARIGEVIAELNLADGERRTQLDVRNAYLDLKNAETQIKEFTAARAQAERNVEVIQLRFRNGLERLIDVFDAENQMRDLDYEYLNLLVSYNRSKDAMSQLLGVDVETLL
jgi:outer membrane protein